MPEPDPPPRTHPVTIDIETVAEPLKVRPAERPAPAPLLPPAESWSIPTPDEVEEVAKAKEPATIDIKSRGFPWFRKRPRKPRPAPKAVPPATSPPPPPHRKPRSALARREWRRLGAWALLAGVVWGAVWAVIGGSWEGFQREIGTGEKLREHLQAVAPEKPEDLPWQRVDSLETRAWTLDDWDAHSRKMQAETATVARLLAEAPKADGEESRPALAPDWEALGGDSLPFNAQLLASGLTQAQLAGHFREFAVALAELERQTSLAAESAVPPSEDELRAFYNEHVSEIAVPETFHVRHIFLAAHAGTPPEKAEEQRLAADRLAKRLRESPDVKLADLAETFSEDESTRRIGGLLPRFSEKRMPEDFLAAVKAAKPGELTGPVKTSLGYHLFVVEARLPARRILFDEVRPHLERAFRQARLDIERQRVLRQAER